MAWRAALAQSTFFVAGKLGVSFGLPALFDAVEVALST
jgi:hypothetical protein